MRQLTESLVRFSWAMPLLGAQQLARVAWPSRAAWRRTSATFDALSQAVREELGPMSHSLYEAGDRLLHGAFGVAATLLPGMQSAVGQAASKKDIDMDRSGAQSNQKGDHRCVS